MSYRGSCHCGAVEFEVEGAVPAEAIECNCSHCRRKGLLLVFVPAAQFRLAAGEEALESYFFNRHVIRHRFCRVCGVQPFAEGENQGVAVRAVNLRCVPGIDLSGLSRRAVDGASF